MLKKTDEKLDLLYLEEFECVTQEMNASVRFTDPSNKAPVFETGRLYINSKSLIFVPKINHKPFYKFLFKHFNGKPSLDTGTVGFNIFITKIVEIKRDGPPSPFFHQAVKQKESETIHFEVDSEIDLKDILSWISMLIDLKDEESNIDDMVQHVTTLMVNRFNIQGLDNKITESATESLIIKGDMLVQRILPMVESYGFLYLTNKHFYFKSLVSTANTNYIKVPLKNIIKVMKRRLYLVHRAIEIELEDKSYFYFGFKHQEERDRFYDILISYCTSKIVTEKSLHLLQTMWINREISNYDYLLNINQLALRSFNDLSQYPVFPWLLINFDSETIDLEDEDNYRNLKEPIGALNKRRLEFFKKRYQQLPDGEKFMYGTHYSTPGYVCGYLIRSHPLYMLRLQNGKFDLPDRLFYSIKKDWKNCYEHDGCVKELLPEFYGTNTDFLVNKLHLKLGARQNQKIVDNVKLPKWAKTPEEFLKINRQGKLISFRI